jgi:hypothetical protein
MLGSAAKLLAMRGHGEDWADPAQQWADAVEESGVQPEEEMELTMRALRIDAVRHRRSRDRGSYQDRGSQGRRGRWSLGTLLPEPEPEPGSSWHSQRLDALHADAEAEAERERGSRRSAAAAESRRQLGSAAASADWRGGARHWGRSLWQGAVGDRAGDLGGGLPLRRAPPTATLPHSPPPPPPPLSRQQPMALPPQPVRVPVRAWLTLDGPVGNPGMAGGNHTTVALQDYHIPWHAGRPSAAVTGRDYLSRSQLGGVAAVDSSPGHAFYSPLPSHRTHQPSSFAGPWDRNDVADIRAPLRPV